MRTERLVFLLTAVGTFLVYFFTSAPGLGLVDSGELTVVTKTLSIAHPTGYPLYTMLGRIWHLLLPVNPARAMVLFSVACASISMAVVSLIAFQLLKQFVTLEERLLGIAAVLLACALAFSKSVWTAVSFAEVYPLTLLLTALVIWIAVRRRLFGEPNSALDLLVVYLWGLGFGNHFTILWFFPIIAWLVIGYVRESAHRVKAILISALALACGLSVNLFLPIRSSVEPLLDWSDPQTLSGLMRHLTAWQYRVWMFKGSLLSVFSGFGKYLVTLPQDFGWLLTVLAVIGLVRILLHRKWFLLMFPLTWLIGVIYNLNYSIPDISTYFVAFYGPLFMLTILGFLAFTEMIWRVSPILRTALILIGAALPVTWALASVLPIANESKNDFATDYTRSVLSTLPDSAIVFQANWDIQSPFIYLQEIEHVRSDVTMFDLALMQRPWYLKQEERRHPELFAQCKATVSEFEQSVAPFEAGEPYDGTQLENAYVAMINCLVERFYEQRPVYVRDTRLIGHPKVAAHLSSLPGGYFFRITNDSLNEPLFDPTPLLKEGHPHDDREQYLFRQAGVTMALRGSYDLSRDNVAEARECLRIATDLAPNDQIVQKFAADLKTVAQVDSL